MTFLPPIDSEAEHVDVKTGRPSKDFYNWIKSISDMVSKGFRSLVVGNPTGGNKGLGSINAEAIYVNGVAVNADPQLYSDVPIVVITANTVIVAAHKAKSLLMQGTTAGQAVTIQNKASGAPGQGATVTIENYSTQPWALTPGAGVTLFWAPTLAGGGRTLAAGASCTIHAVFDDTWSLTGVGIS